jgi:hypothetical protein
MVLTTNLTTKQTDFCALEWTSVDLPDAKDQVKGVCGLLRTTHRRLRIRRLGVRIPPSALQKPSSEPLFKKWLFRRTRPENDALKASIKTVVVVGICGCTLAGARAQDFALPRQHHFAQDISYPPVTGCGRVYQSTQYR